MKKICRTVIIFVYALMIGCTYDSDGSFISLEIQDAVVFENNENYMVGDTIFFDLNFSRYLDEEGFTNKLDIFESTGSESFYYNFNLNKFSEQAGGFRRIDVAEEFIFSELGTLSGRGGATADLNRDRKVYESRVGIILVEPGNFQLDLDFFALRNLGYIEDKVQLTITHQFSSGTPIFEFAVTDP